MANDEKEKIINFYKKRIEPFVAIFILAFLVTGCVLLYQDNQLKNQIADTCGYENNDYICYCEKNFVDEMMAQQSGLPPGGIDLNVQMDGNNSAESID